MAEEQTSSADACPVDHKTRAAWLEKSKSHPPPSPSLSASTSSKSCDSSKLNQSTSSPILQKVTSSLDTNRVISSIPRSPLDSSTPAPSAANNEQETGASKSGHWIYPSEKQFFDALKRKKFAAEPQDMASIVPIHNAVNERAWKEILVWEAGRGADKCGGPKLASFSGKNETLTPKAWINTFFGYSKPFDRHDWVVDRCGTQVEYVIDFYEGRNERIPGKPLNFYLDVRPKLNTWEGWRTRFGGLIGL